MKCKNCGYELKDADLFCPECGTKVKNEEEKEKKNIGNEESLILVQNGDKTQPKCNKVLNKTSSMIGTTLLIVVVLLFCVNTLINGFDDTIAIFTGGENTHTSKVAEEKPNEKEINTNNSEVNEQRQIEDNKPPNNDSPNTMELEFDNTYATEDDSAQVTFDSWTTTGEYSYKNDEYSVPEKSELGFFIVVEGTVYNASKDKSIFVSDLMENPCASLFGSEYKGELKVYDKNRNEKFLSTELVPHESTGFTIIVDIPYDTFSSHNTIELHASNFVLQLNPKGQESYYQFVSKSVY